MEKINSTAFLIIILLNLLLAEKRKYIFRLKLFFNVLFFPPPY